MPATVIVGLQWGDEGKGKTTDFLAEQVAMVVRYQGGDNAGHTVVSGDEVFKLRLTPVGRALPAHHVGHRQRRRGQPGDAHRRARHARRRAASTSSRVRVSRSAHVIMPYHVALDRANEARLGGAKVGHDRARDRARPTATGPGASACGWRTCSTAAVLRERIERALPDKNLLLGVDGRRAVRGRRRSSSRRLAWGERLRDHLDDTTWLVQAALAPRRARPARGRPGHAPRPRPRQLPVRDLVEPGRRRRLHRRRDRPAPGRRGHRGHEGLLDAGRLRAVPDRAARRDRRRDRRARPRVRDRRPGGRAGSAGSTPCRCATRSPSTASAAIMLNKLDILSGHRDDPAVRRLRDRRPAGRDLAVERRRARRGRRRSTRSSRAGPSRSTTSARWPTCPRTPGAT